MLFEGVFSFCFRKHYVHPTWSLLVQTTPTSSPAPGTWSFTSLSYPSCVFTHNFATSSSLFFFFWTLFQLSHRLFQFCCIQFRVLTLILLNTAKNFFVNEVYYRLPKSVYIALDLMSSELCFQFCKSHSALRILLVLLHLSNMVWQACNQKALINFQLSWLEENPVSAISFLLALRA